MAFATKYDRERPVYYTPSGSDYLTTYEYRIDKEGVKELVPTGKKNIQEMIDAALESTEIHTMLQKFMNGDTTALDRVRGVYLDTRNMPENYAELFNRNEECKQMFEKLPADIKEKFNNSYTQFWSSYGSETFMRALFPDKFVIEDNDIKEGDVE